MKRKFLLISLILFLSLANAQTAFGVKAGYNLSSMKWQFDNNHNNDYRFDSKSFFYAGAFSNYSLNNKFSLQGELLFTQLGGQSTENLTQIVGDQIIEIGTATVKYKTSQLQVPVSLKYLALYKLSFSAGINFAFNISSTATSNFNYDGIVGRDTTLFKTINISPFLGTEYMISNQIFADARYNFGLFNSAVSGAPKTKIGFLQVGLGYKFN